MSTEREFETVTERRNQFYRDGFRRQVTILIFLLLTCIGLLTTYVLISWVQSDSKFYASTTTGNVVPIEALNSPVVTMDYIRQWSATVARGAYSLDFVSYNDQLKKIATYFTNDGWNAYQKALTDAGLLDQIKQEKLSLSAVVNGPVVIINRYIRSGCYTWEVQLPVLLLFSSSSMNVKKQIYVSMTIKRVPELEISRGIAVTNFQSNGGGGIV